jgi:hypothetical protein
MILKANNYLGDNIHAYMIVKNIRDNGQNASLIINQNYHILFEQKYLLNDSTNIDYDFSKINHGLKYLTDKSLHVRDDISKNFTDIKPISHKLQINPFKFNNKTAIICNRSVKPEKEWHGKWNDIIHYLSHNGYSIIFDNPEYDLSTITSYIAGANFVISIDTGLIHIADAYGVPVVGLYEKNLNRYHPYMSKNTCLEIPLRKLTPTHIIDKIEELKWSDKYGLSDSIEGIL